MIFREKIEEFNMMLDIIIDIKDELWNIKQELKKIKEMMDENERRILVRREGNSKHNYIERDATSKLT